MKKTFFLFFYISDFDGPDFIIHCKNSIGDYRIMGSQGVIIKFFNFELEKLCPERRMCTKELALHFWSYLWVEFRVVCLEVYHQNPNLHQILNTYHAVVFIDKIVSFWRILWFVFFKIFALRPLFDTFCSKCFARMKAIPEVGE